MTDRTNGTTRRDSGRQASSDDGNWAWMGTLVARRSIGTLTTVMALRNGSQQDAAGADVIEQRYALCIVATSQSSAPSIGIDFSSAWIRAPDTVRARHVLSRHR